MKLKIKKSTKGTVLQNRSFVVIGITDCRVAIALRNDNIIRQSLRATLSRGNPSLNS